MRTSRGELKRLINQNIDKISSLNTKSHEAEKFATMTKSKIEELLSKIKETKDSCIEKSEGLERRLTNKLDKFKDETEQRFNI